MSVPSPLQASITIAGRDAAAGIGAILGPAFHDDPLGQWIAPDPTMRTVRLTRLFELWSSAFTLPHGEVRRAGDSGAALWLPPGRWQVPPLLLLRNIPSLGRIFGRRTALLLRGLSQVESHHPRDPHWYVPFIGVVPDQQGRGIGSGLLDAVLRQCDRDGTPAYLEATSERNRALYLHHGFVVRGELELPEGPTLWPMWRDPARVA